MEHDPIGRDARRKARQRKVGQGEACATCHEKDPRALVRVGNRVLCYECLAAEQDRSPTEDHHPAGAANSPCTVGTPGNDHRVLNDDQHDWPPETLRNPDGSPLLKAAACLRGWLDVLRLIMDRVVGWIPEFLESLDGWLRERLGPCWWCGMPVMWP